MPDNALLWKFTHRRLEAGRDPRSMLAIAGRLNPKLGGPSVMAPIDPGHGADAQAPAILGAHSR